MGNDSFDFSSFGKGKSLADLVNSQFKNIQASNEPTHKQLQQMAVMALPFVQQFKNSPEKDMALTMTAMIPVIIGMGLATGEYDDQIEEISQKARSLSKNDLKMIVAMSFLGQKAATQQYAETAKAVVKDLTESEYTALAKAIQFILPAKLRGAYDKSVIAKHPTFEKALTAEYKKLKDTSIEKLAEERMQALNAMPVNAITDAVHEMLQNMTPQNIKTFLNHFNNTLDGQAYANLISSGVDFAEDFGKASAAGKYLQVDDKQTAIRFGDALRTVLQALEDSFLASGIAPKNGLENIAKEYDANKKRLAAGNDNKAPGRGRRKNGPSFDA